MIVVDTNVLSEFMRPQPASQVARWLENAQPNGRALGAISVMEITYGVTRVPACQRKDAQLVGMCLARGRCACDPEHQGRRGPGHRTRQPLGLALTSPARPPADAVAGSPA